MLSLGDDKKLCFRTASLGQARIQCEACRAKTKLFILLTWPPCDKSLLGTDQSPSPDLSLSLVAAAVVVVAVVF